MKPAILILHAPGTNRDDEAARACSMAGGNPEIVHINLLRQGERQLHQYQAVILPGGFTYGDALGAGTRLALDMQIFLQEELQTFIDRGRHVLGICNGFQALVKSNLLPGKGGLPWQDDETPAKRRVTLTANANGRFECRWIHLQVNRSGPSPVLHSLDELIFCPVAHGEGNFQTDAEHTVKQLESSNLIAFRYVDDNGSPAQGKYPLNPNGSVHDIAGICNRRGNVLGLMPHPEDHLMAIQNPRPGSGAPGLKLFQAFVEIL